LYEIKNFCFKVFKLHRFHFITSNLAGFSYKKMTFNLRIN